MIYLDHAASTPMRAAAIDAVTAHLGVVGNPSSLHAAGRAARRVVEESRERIATAYSVDPVEVVLTSGGTEADNLAVAGIFRARRAADERRRVVVSSPVEHPAVLEAVRDLADAEPSWLPVDGNGIVDVDALHELLRVRAPEIALITVMAANNETGVRQPIHEIAALGKEFGVPVHIDGVQDNPDVDVDAMSVSAHKLGGPVGIGALLVRRGTPIRAVTSGGGQERDLRSGTLDAVAAAGFAAALDARDPGETTRLAELRDDLLAGLRRAVPSMVETAPGAPRVASIAHVAFPGCDNGDLLMLLDEAGLCCSTGSACASGVAGPSHVLEVMGLHDDVVRGALRLSVGHTTSAAEVHAAVEIIAEAVPRAAHARLAGAAR